MTKIALTLSVVDGDAEDSLTLMLTKEEVKEVFGFVEDLHWQKEHRGDDKAEFPRRLADTVLGYAEWSPHSIQEWFGYNYYCEECGMLMAFDESGKCARHGGQLAEDEGVENVHDN
jgi:hypothetical protein